MPILPLNSPYAHGFARAAIATPRVWVADPRYNGRQVLDLAQAAADDHASLVVFPELALSGYSNEDLFFQDALLDSVLAALAEVVQRTRELEPILVVGAPLRSCNALFNCAVVLHRGQVRGVILSLTCRTTASSTRSGTSLPRAPVCRRASISTVSTCPLAPT